MSSPIGATLTTVTTGASVDIKPHLRSYLVVLAVYFIYFAQLMAVVGSGFLAQSIASLFNGSAQVVWLGSTVNIITTALSLPFSQAADLVGRRWFLVLPTTMGCVGAIITSRAQNMATIIGGYCILSISFGAQPLLLAVASEVLPRKHRPFAQAGANCSAGVGAIVGLCMAGVLVKGGNLENFRIYFYVNAGVFALASIICLVLYNPPPRDNGQGLTGREKIRRLDWVGYCTMPVGLVLFCMGLAWAENPFSWSSVHVLAPLLIGAAVLSLWVIYETRITNTGMLHRTLFKHRNFGLVLAAIGVEGFVFFSCNNYFPFEVGVLKPANILVIGLHFVVVFGVSLCAAIGVAAFATYKKVTRAPMVGGFSMFMIFCVLMATSTQHTSGGSFWGYAVILGVGFGAVLPTLFSAAQFGTPPERIGLATGLMVASRGLGGAIALAVDNAIFQAALSTVGSKVAAATLPLGLPESSLTEFIGVLLSGDNKSLLRVPGVTVPIAAAGGSAVLDVYELGFRNVWICASCVTFVAVVATTFTREPSVDFTGHIDAPVEVVQSRTTTSEEKHFEEHQENSPLDKDKGFEHVERLQHVDD